MPLASSKAAMAEPHNPPMAGVVYFTTHRLHGLSPRNNFACRVASTWGKNGRV